jgi:transcriptional regulator with XRE-family HTH domain
MEMNTQATLPIWAVKIKARRIFLGESQEKFGARFNVSKMAVSKWETGKSEPGADVLVWVLMK